MLDGELVLRMVEKLLLSRQVGLACIAMQGERAPIA